MDQPDVVGHVAGGWQRSKMECQQKERIHYVALRQANARVIFITESQTSTSSPPSTYSQIHKGDVSDEFQSH